MQTGLAAATACTRFMEEKMERSGVESSFCAGDYWQSGDPHGERTD